jgi:hypothetical protein
MLKDQAMAEVRRHLTNLSQIKRMHRVIIRHSSEMIKETFSNIKNRIKTSEIQADLMPVKDLTEVKRMDRQEVRM